MIVVIIVPQTRNAVISWVKKTLIEKFRTLNLSYVSMYSVEVLVRCAPIALNKVIRRYTRRDVLLLRTTRGRSLNTLTKRGMYLGGSEMTTISSFYFISLNRG